MMLADNTEVVIPSSKRKLAVRLATLVGIVGWGIWVLTSPEGHVRYGSLPWKVFAVICIPIGFWSAITTFRRLLDPSPALVFDKDGMLDCTGMNTRQRLQWTEITSVEVKDVVNQRFIVLRVRDTKTYLSNAGIVGRINGYLSLMMYGGPIFLSVKALSLDLDIDDVAAKLQEFKNKYGDA